MIRPFDPRDAEACCGLIHACFREDTELPPALRRALIGAESPRSMTERSRLFYVAVWDMEGAVAGLGGLDMNEIRMLYVSPAHQRRGIGRALLAHLEAMVPPALFADIFVYAAISALGFYRACGYIPGGEQCFDIGGEHLPTIFMTRRLRAIRPHKL